MDIVETVMACSESIVSSMLVQIRCSFTLRNSMGDTVEWFPV